MPRPRSIAEDDLLERALLLFWEHGYDRTSIADLSEAIGVGPSSLYNAFGSKRELFARALERYMSTYAAFTRPILERVGERSADESVRELLRGAVRLYTRRELPPGCAMMQSGGAGAPEDSEACAITLELKQELEHALHKLLAARARAGDALSAPPRTLAKFLVATMRGLSQLACDGASQRELLQVADHASRSCVLREVC